MFLLHASYAYKESRYAIPIAPFLIDYFFRGLHDFRTRFTETIGGSQKMLSVQQKQFLALWIVGLLAFDAILIVYGDEDSMGPSSQLLLVARIFEATTVIFTTCVSNIRMRLSLVINSTSS